MLPTLIFDLLAKSVDAFAVPVEQQKMWALTCCSWETPVRPASRQNRSISWNLPYSIFWHLPLRPLVR